jgi:hypothetical protein
VYLNGFVMNRPEVMVAHAAQQFDSAGNLVDENTRQHVVKLLHAFVEFVGLFRR